jgi:hypothetical protein
MSKKYGLNLSFPSKTDDATQESPQDQAEPVALENDVQTSAPPAMPDIDEEIVQTLGKDRTPGLENLKEDQELAQAYRFATCPKTTLTFSSVPMLIDKEIERVRKQLKMGKKELFYHALRLAGCEIPPYDKIHRKK